MTRQCERCGEALHPCEAVVLVMAASLEDFNRGRLSAFEIVAVYHSACYDEIGIWEIDPDDEDALREACNFCGHPVEVDCAECVSRRIRGLRA
jgi:hypothetical protein